MMSLRRDSIDYVDAEVFKTDFTSPLYAMLSCVTIEPRLVAIVKCLIKMRL